MASARPRTHRSRHRGVRNRAARRDKRPGLSRQRWLSVSARRHVRRRQNLSSRQPVADARPRARRLPSVPRTDGLSMRRSRGALRGRGRLLPRRALLALYVRSRRAPALRAANGNAAVEARLWLPFGVPRGAGARAHRERASDSPAGAMLGSALSRRYRALLVWSRARVSARVHGGAVAAVARAAARRVPRQPDRTGGARCRTYAANSFQV